MKLKDIKLKEFVHVGFLIGGIVVFGIGALMLTIAGKGDNMLALLVPGILLFMAGVGLFLYGLLYRTLNWIFK